MIDLLNLRDQLIPVVTQLEGPYKWYVMGAAGLLLTALITRFIFKTFKWFVLLVLLMGGLIGGLLALMNIAAS
jgi:hypothetical protein